MTYDELLAKIDERNLSFSHPDSVFSFNDWTNKALRAVVELHKQIDDNSCHYCAHWYPCETIQAIEKALG